MGAPGGGWVGSWGEAKSGKGGTGVTGYFSKSQEKGDTPRTIQGDVNRQNEINAVNPAYGGVMGGLAGAQGGGGPQGALSGGLAGGQQGVGNMGGQLGDMGGKTSDWFGKISGGHGMIGTAGGVAGTGIPGPAMPNIQQGTNTGDVINSQNQTLQDLGSQRALLAALQGQNALGMQSGVAGQQQSLANQLGAANGLQTQQGAIQGLQGAAGMYGDIAQGRGPNPAMAALNQATGQNVANQAALMAGQRGAGANAGLLARQAAQQGGALQQQAVGQGATMQAQQQINALQGLTGTQQAIGGMGGQQLAAQQAQQQAMANQANLMAGQQIGATQANAQASLANQAQLQQALQGVNASNVAAQGNVNAANASLANTQMQGQQAVTGGLMQGAGHVLGSMFGAKGGEVKKMASGGTIAAPQPIGPAPVAGPQSSYGNFLSNWQTGRESMPGTLGSQSMFNFGDEGGRAAMQKGASGLGGGAMMGIGKLAGLGGGAAAVGSTFGGQGTEALGGGEGVYSEGVGEGDIDAATSELGEELPAESGEAAGEAAGETAADTAVAAHGGMLADRGGPVAAKSSSQKAVKSGDHYDNDKVPAKLSEGEIVLPRSVTMSSDPIRSSADFVRKVLAKRKVRA